MGVFIGPRKVLSHQDGWGTQNVNSNQRSFGATSHFLVNAEIVEVESGAKPGRAHGRFRDKSGVDESEALTTFRVYTPPLEYRHPAARPHENSHVRDSVLSLCFTRP